VRTSELRSVRLCPSLPSCRLPCRLLRLPLLLRRFEIPRLLGGRTTKTNFNPPLCEQTGRDKETNGTITWQTTF